MHGWLRRPRGVCCGVALVLGLLVQPLAVASPPAQIAPLFVILTQSPSPQGIVLTATIPADRGLDFDPAFSSIQIEGVPVSAGRRPVTYLSSKQISTVLLPTDVGRIVATVRVDPYYVTFPETITVGQFGPTPTGVPVTATPVVPELPPLALFGSGLLALGWLGRRARHCPARPE